VALIDSEGFGFSPNAADYITYGVASGAAGTINTAGPYGDNYVTLAGSGAGFIKVFPVGCTNFFFGARMKFTAGQPGPAFFFLDAVNNILCSVLLTAGSGAVQAFSGATAPVPAFNSGYTSTPLGISVAGACPLAGWFYLEIGVVLATTAGSIIVRVNGGTVLSATGVNTICAPGFLQGPFPAPALISQVAIAASNSNNGFSAASCSLMHMYLCDNTGSAPWNSFLGDVRVQTLLPTANDAVAFTPNGLSANWQNVSQVPPVPGSDYNSDATVGAQDTFTTGAMASNLGTIFGVNVKTLLAKSDAGVRTAAGVAKSGGTTLAATAVYVSTSLSVAQGVFQTDPNTAAPWTPAAVNAAKFGYKIVA
jgi:hypothetical protein